MRTVVEVVVWVMIVGRVRVDMVGIWTANM